jgi:hypothetical protein
MDGGSLAGDYSFSWRGLMNDHVILGIIEQPKYIYHCFELGTYCLKMCYLEFE